MEVTEGFEEHRPFLQAIRDDEFTLENWLVYADWLEERGDEFAEVIRTDYRLWKPFLDAVFIEKFPGRMVPLLWKSLFSEWEERFKDHPAWKLFYEEDHGIPTEAILDS